MKLHWYAIALALCGLRSTAAAASDELPDCGRLNENQVFKEAPIAGLDEFPWLARVYYSNRQMSSLRDFKCLAVLVSKRHLVSLASCFLLLKEFRAETVVLGDSNAGNSDTESDCDAAGRCAPPPAEYAIEDVALHPNYEFNRNTENNIAVIQLTHEVELGAFIQPICLPPANLLNVDLLGQYFVDAGFLRKEFNGMKDEKVKIVVHVLPKGRCSQLYGFDLPEEDICTSSVLDVPLMAGSALMAINVENNELRNYYLLGIMHSGSRNTDITLRTHTRISRNINWILSNMNRRRGPKPN